MSELIKFPKSYVFVAGYDVYNSFIAKHISSLPIHGNNIAYYSSKKQIPEYATPNEVVEYYKQHADFYSKESAAFTVLDSPLLDSLVRFIVRYKKYKHIGEKECMCLLNRYLDFIRQNIDMSTVYYIYLRHYPYGLTSASLTDTIINHFLTHYRFFNHSSIYSKEEDRRVKRFDDLLTARSKKISKINQFNGIINKEV